MNLLGTLLDLFLRFGYAAVLFGVMAENAGIPLPGETILLAAGFFASQGHFQVGMVILLAVVGATVGDNLGYFMGAKVARPFLARRGRFLLLTPARVQAAEAFFARHGDKTILFARFISGLRVVAALVAGLSGMRWRIFAVYNAAGAVLWATVMALLGYFFGASWSALEKWVGLGGLVALGIVVLVCILVGLLHHARALRHAVTAVLPRSLGLREGLILLANLTALSLISKVMEDVVTGESGRLDLFLLGALHQAPGSRLVPPLLLGSALGSLPVVLIATGVLARLLLRRRARREATALVAAAGIAEVATLALLFTVRRTHPSLWDALIPLCRYSFPSGHALVATATYGMAAYLVGERRPALKVPVWFGTGLLVLLIGVSQVALGANWPTDVLGGFAAGLLILWATIYWYERNYVAIFETLTLMGRRGDEQKQASGTTGGGGP